MNHRPFQKTPLFTLAAIVTVYVVITLFAMFAERTWNWNVFRPQLLVTRCLILVGGCVLAGIARVMRYHPRYLPNYSAWLMTTPWRPGLRLPLGPVVLVWEDLLLIIPLGLLAGADAGIGFVMPIGSYLLGHCVAAIDTTRGRVQTWLIFVLAFILSWLFYASDQ